MPILQAEKLRLREGKCSPKVTQLVDRLKPKLGHQDEDDGGENTDHRAHLSAAGKLSPVLWLTATVRESVPTRMCLFA